MNDFKQFFLLDPSVTFLNHGSFGATPRPVFEAYQRWQRELESQPVEFLGRRADGLMRYARGILAEYVGTQADNLVFVANATTGINIVARSLHLKPGDEVLSTDHEYGALDRTWRFLAGKQGFKYINHPISLPVSSVDDFVEHFWRGVTPSTRVIYMSQITSPTALIFPVEAICRRARQQGILTVIDGAHAPGQISIKLDELGADFYSGNLHKWLCAPKGSAFLFARPETQPLLEPLVVSWGWESENPSPSHFIDILEWTGTRDLSPFLAVPDAIAFSRLHDWDNVRADCHRLAAATQHRLTQLTGLPPLSVNSDWFAQMATAQLPAHIDPLKFKERLYNEFRIEAPIVSWNSRQLVRFSFQAYNTQADADALVDAIARMI